MAIGVLADAWDAAVINMVVEVLVIDVWTDVVMAMLSGVKIIVVAAVAIALEFAVPLRYVLDVPFDMAVDAFMDALIDVIMNCVLGIGAEVLTDTNIYVFASLMTDLEFAMPAPWGECSNC